MSWVLREGWIRWPHGLVTTFTILIYFFFLFFFCLMWAIDWITLPTNIVYRCLHGSEPASWLTRCFNEVQWLDFVYWSHDDRSGIDLLNSYTFCILFSEVVDSETSTGGADGRGVAEKACTHRGGWCVWRRGVAVENEMAIADRITVDVERKSLSKLLCAYASRFNYCI